MRINPNTAGLGGGGVVGSREPHIHKWADVTVMVNSLCCQPGLTTQRSLPLCHSVWTQPKCPERHLTLELPASLARRKEVSFYKLLKSDVVAHACGPNAWKVGERAQKHSESKDGLG